MNRLMCAAVVSFAVLLPVGHIDGQARTGEPLSLETLRERVARNESLIDPIKLNYTVKISRTGEPPQPTGGLRRLGRLYAHCAVVRAQSGARQYVRHQYFYGPDERCAPPLVGRPMPDLAGLGLSVDRKQLKERGLLVCFFDMEQRPARNCVEELAARTASLQEQEITVPAVHEKGVEADRLRAWMKETGITFPIGIVADDPGAVKFAWAVRSLPWLVLADEKHIVRAEGFSTDELEGRIRQMRSE